MDLGVLNNPFVLTLLGAIAVLFRCLMGQQKKFEVLLERVAAYLASATESQKASNVLLIEVKDTMLKCQVKNES